MNIKELPLWDADRCADIAQRALKATDLQLDRGHFYTISAATYQDDPYAYPAIANKFNPGIAELFDEELTDVSNVLEQWLNIHTVHVQGTGLPGFHIFDKRSNGRDGHPHIDEPHKRVRWPCPVVETFSFTVLVKAPPLGAGMDYWPNHTDADIERYMETGELPPHEHHAYKLGHLTVHDGLTPHRIANTAENKELKDEEHRITLQGHGALLAGGRTALYF